MIKEGKDKREKNGNVAIKTEIPGPQVTPPEATVKEEPGTESHLNGVEEGGGTAPTSNNPSCSHPDVKPNLIGSTNAGTVPVSRTRNSSGTPGSNDLCLGDNPQEGKHEDTNSQEKPPSCSVVKTEVNGSNNHEFSGDRCEGVALPTTSGPPPNGIQPLPSNVINKQPGTMEAQYMQQQSQIFVFSTALANKSAEAVLLGQFPSIIAYHCAQPGTKKYLEKHPLKMNQFNRQNPAQWLNNLAQMKQKGPGGPAVMKGMNPMGLPGGFQGPPNMMSDGGPPGGPMDMWNQNNMMNPMMQPCPNNALPGCPGSNPMAQGRPMKDTPCMMAGSPTSNPMMGHHSPNMPNMPGGPTPDLAGSPVMNQGVKIPDENLTPQQRQHREEQLALLRNMKQMLFPEHQSPGGPGPLPDGVNMGPQQEGVPMHVMGPIMGPGGGIMPQKGMMMTGMPGQNQITPTSVAAQIEWQKLQHQFYEERKKKGPSGLGMGGSGVGSPGGPGQPRGMPGSGPRTQGPPPPYHQTPRSASVPTAMPSPNPGSPNNPTSNLSLPSPRAASGLNSPAEPNRQQFGGSQGRMVGPGPSPTSLDSPNGSRPLNQSNPGTPVSSTHLSPGSVRKELSQNGSEFSSGSQPNGSSQQPPVDGMFCRTLQSLAQQKQQQQQPNASSKEPNLMPVPSPQQIQYLNTFEGQELTIQKQPNTSLKDTNIRSPSIPPSGLDGGLQTPSSDLSTSRLSGGPGTPLTPTSMSYPPTSGDLSRFPIPSPHTPNAGSESKPQQARFPGPSPQSQGSRTPSMDSSLNKTPTSEGGGRFLSTSPQMGDGMGPPRFSGSGGGVTGGSPAMGGSTQGFMPQSMPSMGGMKVNPHFLEVSPSGNPSVDVSPSGPGTFPTLRTENVPLNPNGSLACNGKSAHFDPITSMAQMSQQLTSSVAHSPGGHNTGMMGGMAFNPPGMHPMQMNDMDSCQGMQDPGVVPQAGPQNFVNMQMQNVPPHSYSPTMGGNSVNMNQPVNTNSGSPKPGNMMMGLGPGPPRGAAPYPGPQRMMGRPPGPSPYNGANVQVKASAPNTIQYLPAKPQAGNSGPRGPPSLEFLQRFTNPLSNLDTKVPTHNLQYFPNNGQSNMGGLPMSMNRPPNGLMNNMNPQMGGMPGGPNCGSVGGHGGHMGGMNGPMMGPNGPMVGPNGPMVGPNGPMVGPNGPMVGPNGPMVGPNGPMVGPNGPMVGPNGPMVGPNGPMVGPNGPMVGMNMPMSGGMVMGPGGPGIGMAPLRGSLRPGGMMRMQQMGAGMFGVPNSPGQPVGSDQMFAGGPGQNMSGGNFVPGSKSSPMGLGNAPDASQPLPPSMGQSNNFKNSPFIGPTTSDPNYAQQFHNFQQQLYATNTRSQMNNQSVGPNQSFFVPK